MTLQLRTAILWIFIVFCYLIHGYYHVSGLFFGVDIKLPDATGQIPFASHIFSLLVEILPLAMAIATLYVSKRGFAWANFIVAILFAILNLVHLAETLIKETNDIRQIALLTLIIVVNILLVIDTNKRRKEVSVAH